MNSGKSPELHENTRVRIVDVHTDHSGQRVDNFLIRELKGVPKTRIYRIIRKGEVRVNGKRVSVSTRLAAGDKLRIPPIRTSTQQSTMSPAKNIEKTIIYDSKVMLVINKPAGLAVHGGSGISSGVIESLRLLAPRDNLELIHRLDRDTSGCLMVARNRRYLRGVQAALQEKSVLKKLYLAVVHGRWPARKARIDAPIVKNTLKSGERMSKVAADGKESSTGFRVLASCGEYSLLEVEAITGRTHQIRVHCQYAGHPIVGDRKYGNEVDDQLVKQRHGSSRLMLHAHRLHIPAIEDSPAVDVEAPPDGSLKKLMDYIEQHNVLYQK
jgi:23S rRNA pseudouridine955/2504/2580 synthase